MNINIILPRHSKDTPFLTPSTFNPPATADLPSPAAANPSPSLSAQLSSPLPSKEHVLALLRPSPYARGHTFLRRQLPSVQRVIIQKIVIDWDGQLGDSYQDLWEWFIPSHSGMHTVDGDITVKRDSDAETDSNASVEGAEVAMSTYRLFASFLSKEERAKLHPLSLDFIDCLIPFLLRDHSLCDIYRHLFFNADYVHGVGLSKVHNEWEEHTKVLFALLARSRTDEGRAEVYLSTQYARCQYLFFSSLAPHKDQQQLDGQPRKVSRTDLRRTALQSLLSKLLRTHKPSVHLFSPTISLPVIGSA
ncbi:hypothetical protein BT69DRAFT_1341814 [Atractiella rhizophila]|nr:hypothetical protein BT69DRAFT_1341814 [Atractiella rhizophila]